MRLDHCQVRQLAARRIGAQNIANMLGGSMEDVRRILNPEDASPAERPAPTPPSKPQSRDDRFRAMWVAGVSNLEIMAALGLSHQTVGNLRDRLGLPKRSVGRPAGRLDRKARP